MNKLTEVCAIYFTGTGNTKKVALRVAKAAADALGCPCREYDFSLPAARQDTLSFGSDTLVILGTPVYAGRVPNVLLPYLTKNLRGDETPAVPVVTFGNRNFDDALIELRDLMEADGFHTVAAGAFAAEHSFSLTLGANRPDEDDLALADKLGQRAAQKLLAGGFPPAHPVAVDGQTPIRPYYTPRDRNGVSINILKVKPKTDPDKCIRCGLCASLCTMGSIDPTDVSHIPGICIKCCACVKRCPQGAKYYDDAGYLYHRDELEQLYARRAESKLFV